MSDEIQAQLANLNISLSQVHARLDVIKIRLDVIEKAEEPVR